MTPSKDGAPWSGSGGAGEFGDELKRAHEHQNSKMAAESAAAVAAGIPSTPKGAPTDSVTSASGDARSPTPRSESSPRTPASSSGGGGGGGTSGFSDRTAAADAARVAAAAVATADEERPETTSTPDEKQQPPPEEEHSPARNESGTMSPGPSTPPEDSAEKSVAAVEEPEEPEEPEGPEGDGAAAGGGGVGGEEETGELEPGKHRLRALYDYDATEAGDLSFRAGDMIISDEGAFSGSGWASGECHGDNGNFPANYTEPW